jgi:hypothetical protein
MPGVVMAMFGWVATGAKPPRAPTLRGFGACPGLRHCPGPT